MATRSPEWTTCPRTTTSRSKRCGSRPFSATPPSSFYPLDLADRVSVVRLFDAQRFDVVIHLAAQPGVRYSLDAPFTRSRERPITMAVRDAEMTKYTANAMLAMRISFMNELAAVCERLEVDVEQVRIGIGSDRRIGHALIYPGCGYGGSCFPKDIRALIRMAQEAGIDAALFQAIEARNQAQKHVLFDELTARFGRRLAGHKFGVWGLAFKPGTDDMREAPAAALVEHLIHAGAAVSAFDLAAINTARTVFPKAWFDSGRLRLADDPYDAMRRASALLLVTEWKQFRSPDLPRMRRIMRLPVIFDGRNQFEPGHMAAQGFEYHGIGRGSRGPTEAATSGLRAAG
jgi:UDPglucose 6-dehydrogenase